MTGYLPDAGMKNNQAGKDKERSGSGYRTNNKELF